MRAWGTKIELEMRMMELDICVTPDGKDFEISFRYGPNGTPMDRRANLLVITLTADQFLDVKDKLKKGMEMYEAFGYTLPSR